MPRVYVWEEFEAHPLHDDGGRRTFTKSRRRREAELKRTGLARDRGSVRHPRLHRLVEKGEVVPALLHVYLRDEGFSSNDTPILRDLLKTIAKNGLQATKEVFPRALLGLQSCTEWFIEHARPRAIRAVYDMLQAGPRHLCAACKLLEELLAPKVAELAT